MGIAGEMLCHSHGPENAKNRAEGITTRNPVAMLMGLSREFWSRPPPQKNVLPVKYSWFFPKSTSGKCSFLASMGPGDESGEDNREWLLWS